MSALIVEDRKLGRWITFNRPAQLNAWRVEDLRDTRAAVSEAANDGRPIVFTGAGERAFCAGMNLDVFAELVQDPSRTRETIGALGELLDTVRTAETLTVAAINGHCLGAALELALVCDFRLARPTALLGLPELKLGLPCILDSALLSQYVGLGLAKEMILTGRLYPAGQLAPSGIATVIDDATALDREVENLLSSLANVPRAGIASQKRLFEVWQNLPLDDANARSLDEIVRVFEDEETRRRVTAYTDELRSGQAS
jgi:enoyl-CoA hydratase/carnithine racemase